jgi:serine protease DegQ
MQGPLSRAGRPVAVLLTIGVTALASGCTGSTPSSSGSSSGGGGSSSAASAAPSASASSTAAAAEPGSATKGLPAVPGVVKEVEPSVVTIRSAIGLGSGVVYRSNGVIVTDAHVVEDKQKHPYNTVKVQFADGKQASAKVLGVDDYSDVAVIKADRTNLPAAKFANATPQVGELAVVIGSPLGLVETVTAGIVSGLHRNMPPAKESPHGLINLMQVDAPISPGNSGGAVCNGDGDVMGLSEAYLPPSSGAVAIGFVTPSATVTDVADQLLTKGKVGHAFLGILPTDITPQVAKRFNLPTSSGALVVDVVNGSPAAKAGMQPGDVVTKVGKSKVSNVVDLLAALRRMDPGQRVQVVVRRDGKPVTLNVTLGG